jgi:Glycosyltransferase Family 4
VRVLITNILLNRGGTESVVRDISLGLAARGHLPIVYSPTLGGVAKELSDSGITVVDDLACVAEIPDIIHGHHFVTAGEALLAFPAVPGVFVCHGYDWLERPPNFPQLTYVAQGDATLDRLLREGIRRNRTTVLHNAVDLRRVPARPAPLPQRPRSACVFSHSDAHVSIVEKAAAKIGITVSKMIGRSIAAPERELVKYDLVFASGRSAIEALCAGCAVVVCDHRGLGGLATTTDYPRLRAQNFGLWTLTKGVTIDSIATELVRYDPADAALVTERIRRDADFETYLDKLEQLYASTIAAHRTSPPAPDHIRRSQQRFLHDALPRKPGDPGWSSLGENAALLELEKLRADLQQCAAEVEKMKRALAGVYDSRSWRLTRPLRAIWSNCQSLLGLPK